MQTRLVVGLTGVLTSQDKIDMYLTPDELSFLTALFAENTVKCCYVCTFKTFKTAKNSSVV